MPQSLLLPPGAAFLCPTRWSSAVQGREVSLQLTAQPPDTRLPPRSYSLQSPPRPCAGPSSSRAALGSPGRVPFPRSTAREPSARPPGTAGLRRLHEGARRGPGRGCPRPLGGRAASTLSRTPAGHCPTGGLLALDLWGPQKLSIQEPTRPRPCSASWKQDQMSRDYGCPGVGHSCGRWGLLWVWGQEATRARPRLLPGEAPSEHAAACQELLT